MTNVFNTLYRAGLFFFICFTLLPGWFSTEICAEDAEPGEGRIERIEDLNRRRLGVITGTVHDRFTNSYLDFTNLIYFDEPQQMIDALYLGEIDAAVDDLPVHKLLVESKPELHLLPGILAEDSYAFAFRMEDTDLHKQINDEIRNMEASGELNALANKWTEMGPEARVMPLWEPGVGMTRGRTVRFGVSPISPPFCYPGPDGAAIGFEIELMQRIAWRLGIRLIVDEMEFMDLIPSLMGGSIDVVGSCFSVTEERRQILMYSDPVYHAGVSVVILGDDVLRNK